VKRNSHHDRIFAKNKSEKKDYDLYEIELNHGRNGYLCAKIAEMKVYINEKEITVFNGATLGEAVLAYSGESYVKLKDGLLGIYDRFGFLTEPDGPAGENRHYVLKEIEK
jgi:hypothetical protein